MPGAKSDTADEQLRERVRSLRLPREVTANRPRGRWLPWLLCAILVGGNAALGYLYWSLLQQKADTPESRPTVASNAPANLVPVAPTSSASSGGLALEAKGYIIPTHQILVSPKVNGMVVKLRITESDRVKKGDVLAELEDTEYRTDRDRAEAALDSARRNLAELEHGYRRNEIEQAAAELAEAEAQRVQLEADYKRSSDLLVKKVISQETYDVSLSKFQAMSRRVQRLALALKLMEEGPRIERIEAARAQVHEAEAELAKAKWRLDNCIIRADLRYDPQEECRGGEPGQSDRHAGFLQPL